MDTEIGRLAPEHFVLNVAERQVTDAFLQCGLAALGIMQALGITMAPHLETGSLVAILEQYRPSVRPVWVLYPNRHLLAPQLQAFVDWVTDLISQTSGPWIIGA